MRIRPVRVGAVCVLAVLWAVSTATRVQLWGDERALWQDAAQQAPTKPRPFVNLGAEYGALGAPDVADLFFLHAIALTEGRPRHEREHILAVVAANQARYRLDLVAWLTATD